MNDQTISQSTLALDMPSFEAARSGCLVKIHPSKGSSGLWPIDCRYVEIGRSSDADIQLDDHSVSRVHTSLEQTNDGIVITDLDSTNGTFVNEQLITQQILRAGDRVRIGNYILKYLSADHIELQYHTTVYQMTTTDGLTGAFNRQYLLECLEREFNRTLRCKSPVSVLLLDIDYFKDVNDTYGHLVGDEVLQQFCERIDKLLHSDNVLARFGGEEFAVILSDTTISQATKVAEAIRNEIALTPFDTQEGPIDVTTSIGAATQSGAEFESANTLIDAADKRLYEAKDAGRNRVVPPHCA